MLTDHLKQLEAARAKVAELEQAIATERNAELAALPARYGFATVNAFIGAVRTASGQRRGPKTSAAKPTTAVGGKRRKRAKITDETRAEVKKLVEAGKTGNEIANAVGISLPSVQNIKKALNLVGKAKPGRKAKAGKS